MTKRVTVKEAAELLEMSPQAVRVGLQRGVLPFGCAIKTSTIWTYHISRAKLYDYLGLSYN